MKKMLPLVLSAGCFLAGFMTVSAQTAPTEQNYTFDPGTTGSNGNGTGTNGSGNWDNTTLDFSNGTSDTSYPVGGVGTTTTTASISGTNTITLTAATIANVLPGEFLSSTAFPAGTYVVSISGDVVTLSANSTVAVAANSSIIFTPSSNEAPTSSTVSTEGNGVNVVFGGAAFTGTPGTVNVSGTQYADNMTLSSSGYTFSGGAIVLGSRSGATGFLNVGASATINSTLTTKNILFTVAGQTLTLGGGSTALGYIEPLNQNGTISASSTLILASGSYAEGTTNYMNIGNLTGNGSDGVQIDTGASYIYNSYNLFVGYGSNGLVTIEGGSMTGNSALVIGRSNSGRVILQSGSLTNTATTSGGLTVGNQGSGELDVQGGTLTTTLLGLGAGLSSTQTGLLNISGGTSNIGTIGFGTGYAGSSGSTAGTATLTLTGGNLYIGAGGITNSGSGTFNPIINFSGGTVGASAAWSSSMNINLATGATGVGAGVAPVTLQAANVSGVGFNINLSGILSGLGGVKIAGPTSGMGTVTLSNTGNSYSGGTLVQTGGSLIAASLGTGAVEVQGGGSLQLTTAGITNLGAFTLDNTLSALSIAYSGTDDMVLSLTVNGIAIAAGDYTVAELNQMSGTQDFSDFGGATGGIDVENTAPEPSTWAMLFLGLGALVVLARRRPTSSL